MSTKQNKLKEAYEYLRSLGKIHTKKDFALAIEFDKTNLSSAFSGNENYLTDGLFKKICEKYPELFNPEYFLNDKGGMLKINTQENNVKTNSGIVGIQGNGHNITNNDISAMIDLQKGYQSMMQKSQEQIDRLIGIIEQSNK
jgi:hypothetical protein